MFEDLGFVDSTARDVSVWFGLLLGLTFVFWLRKVSFVLGAASSGQRIKSKH